MWNPHAGTKPSPLDGEASDGHWEPEDETYDMKDEAFNIQMVDMILELQDDDLCNQEWKLNMKQERKKKNMKQGQFMIMH